jgi:RNA processing factor Prp31
MAMVAPNLTSLLGETVAARLISHAGSLTNLAKFPASTVQILGAEKALFRALKTRGKTPKYGLLFHSTFIGRAGSTNKGRISRFLANKCSIASRIDCFTETPNSVFGDKLREQVEERLKFYETGDVPRKNVDVMKEALDESMNLSVSLAAESKKQKKKKNKKRKLEDDDEANGNGEVAEAQPPLKKKRKHQEDPMETTFYAEAAEEITEEADESQPKKKKKKKKKQEADE